MSEFYDIGDTVQATILDDEGNCAYKPSGFVRQIINTIVIENFNKFDDSRYEKTKPVYRISSSILFAFEKEDLMTTRLILLEKYHPYSEDCAPG